MYHHIVIHILNILNIQALLSLTFWESLHKYRTFLYLAIFFRIALSNVIVLGKLQTLPCMLKVMNGRNLFIVYCFIPYIILKVEIKLHRCGIWHFLSQAHFSTMKHPGITLFWWRHSFNLPRTIEGARINRSAESECTNWPIVAQNVRDAGKCLELTNQRTVLCGSYLCLFCHFLLRALFWQF